MMAGLDRRDVRYCGSIVGELLARKLSLSNPDGKPITVVSPAAEIDEELSKLAGSALADDSARHRSLLRTLGERRPRIPCMVRLPETSGRSLTLDSCPTRSAHNAKQPPRAFISASVLAMDSCPAKSNHNTKGPSRAFISASRPLWDQASLQHLVLHVTDLQLLRVSVSIVHRSGCPKLAVETCLRVWASNVHSLLKSVFPVVRLPETSDRVLAMDSCPTRSDQNKKWPTRAFISASRPIPGNASLIHFASVDSCLVLLKFPEGAAGSFACCNHLGSDRSRLLGPRAWPDIVSPWPFGYASVRLHRRSSDPRAAPDFGEGLPKALEASRATASFTVSTLTFHLMAEHVIEDVTLAKALGHGPLAPPLGTESESEATLQAEGAEPSNKHLRVVNQYGIRDAADWDVAARVQNIMRNLATRKRFGRWLGIRSQGVMSSSPERRQC